MSLSLSDAVSRLNTDNHANCSSSDQFFGLPIGHAEDDSLIFANVSSYCFCSLHIVFDFLGFADINTKKELHAKHAIEDKKFILISLFTYVCCLPLTSSSSM